MVSNNIDGKGIDLTNLQRKTGDEFRGYRLDTVIDLLNSEKMTSLMDALPNLKPVAMKLNGKNMSTLMVPPIKGGEHDFLGTETALTVSKLGCFAVHYETGGRTQVLDQLSGNPYLLDKLSTLMQKAVMARSTVHDNGYDGTNVKSFGDPQLYPELTESLPDGGLLRLIPLITEDRGANETIASKRIKAALFQANQTAKQ